MKYENINYLYLLPLVFIVTAAYVVFFKNRQRALTKFVQAELLDTLVQSVSKTTQIIKAAFAVTAILFIIFSLIQPMWGYRWEEVERRGIDIVVAVDTSRSMLADDIKPNRLEAAKREIKDLLSIVDGDRVGLVAFAGSVFIQCPLTLDYGAFNLFLDDLNTNLIPVGGTAIGDAIKRSMTAFSDKSKKHKAIVLITDGEDHRGNAVEMAKAAKEQGIIIYTIGVGKKEGAYIKIRDKDNNEVLLKDKEGNVIKSHLDEVTLNKIALETGGAYSPAYGTKWGLANIYKNIIAKMEEKQLSSKKIKLYENRFQIPLFIALIFILLESLWGMGAKKKKREENV
ncbi:MAG: VWA domain-containing protein [Candidatus Scalindua sp. AMX11]|nr:MAG: VWA domain-containing protein [Candidatus Scalindua sp.]NOG85466.1 VWA domain-containing protein [Planctomycetota bacterium]RZV90282.1 MAG: VWA domain-containing protein [Candidatus Scalindua sp. SCAELEC01]TDE64692.1 MAG: VWA domain-containing protein [Candidatus Scalindua sp. AMX11]GJQ60801.1 MAG: membrane protein [Candidatus Scalindua sp.]